jgi:hypothetical protein
MGIMDTGILDADAGLIIRRGTVTTATPIIGQADIHTRGIPAACDPQRAYARHRMEWVAFTEAPIAVIKGRR